MGLACSGRLRRTVEWRMMRPQWWQQRPPPSWHQRRGGVVAVMSLACRRLLARLVGADLTHIHVVRGQNPSTWHDYSTACIVPSSGSGVAWLCGSAVIRCLRSRPPFLSLLLCGCVHLPHHANFPFSDFRPSHRFRVPGTPVARHAPTALARAWAAENPKSIPCAHAPRFARARLLLLARSCGMRWRLILWTRTRGATEPKS